VDEADRQVLQHLHADDQVELAVAEAREVRDVGLDQVGPHLLGGVLEEALGVVAADRVHPLPA
jgi:hypothetical protein